MTIMLNWHAEASAGDVPSEWEGLLHRLLRGVEEIENLEAGEVSLTFVDDETIQALNLEYRGVDQPTDVLSFPLTDSSVENEEAELWFEDDVPDLLGDIVISIPTAVRQSESYGHSLEREIGFLFVHGFLHLIGYDHDHPDAERQMFARQEEILQKAGIER